MVSKNQEKKFVQKSIEGFVIILPELLTDPVWQFLEATIICTLR